jgi:iron(III) transport system substrate-binding protein
VQQPPAIHRRIARHCRGVLAGTVLVAGLLVAAAPGVAPPAGAAARRPPLVLYASQGFDAAVAKAFQDATGITVELDTNAVGALLGQVESSRKHPRWGVLWVDGPTAFAHLDQQHLLVRGFEPHVRWNAQGADAVPRDRSYVPTGVTLAEAEIYTTKVVSEPPASWQQLLQPEWRDAVGMDNPAQSGPTFPFIAGMMQHLGGHDGVKAGERYFTKLHDNGLVVRTTNPTTLQALTSGKIKVALVQSSAAAGAVRTDHDLAVKYLPPVTLLPSAIGIDAKAPRAERAEAERFAAFVLSPQGQQVMQSATPDGGSLYYPVVAGEQPAATLPPLASVETQRITPYVWARREHAIDAWFTSHVVQ